MKFVGATTSLNPNQSFSFKQKNSKEGKQWPMYEHHHISNIKIEMNQSFESATVNWWSAYSCPRICEHMLQAFVTDLLCTALTPQLNIHGGCIVWGSTSQPPESAGSNWHHMVPLSWQSSADNATPENLSGKGTGRVCTGINGGGGAGDLLPAGPPQPAESSRIKSNERPARPRY